MHPGIFLLCVILHCCLGQSINSPPLDWIQTDESGAYRYGYATGDEGSHYHVQSATADNTVAGKFGYKDPATGRDLQTTYTAGRRGFRARGPHIARRMDLSQIKPPFSRPNDDGQYHPELDNFFDPTEDRGYDFSYRTSNQIKQEHANRVGDVQGRYTYLDDTGFRHSVNYVAGSKTGFVVSNPVPDTFARARGGALYYVGKSGGSKIRGYTAVQKNLNGAYRFVASGPDHKRSEISDAAGNRRGIYTYLDDKGVQHTVEYIAGPKIGYKVIKNKKGVNYNPVFPLFPDTSTPFPLFPPFSGDSDSDSGKPFDSFLTSNAPDSTPETFPTFGGAFPAPSQTGNAFSSFSNSDGSFPSRPTPVSSMPSAKPPGDKKPSPPSLFTPSTPSSLFEPSSEKPSSSINASNDFDWPKDFPKFPSTSSSSSKLPSPPSSKPQGQIDFGSPLPYDFDYFLKDPANANKDWSMKGRPQKPPTTKKPPTTDPFPDFFPPPFPDIPFDLPDPFREGLNAAETGTGLKGPMAGNGTGDGKGANKTATGTSGSKGSDNSPPSSGSKDYNKEGSHFGHSSGGTVKFGIVKKHDWHHVKHENGYFSIPPGIAVRAHVQSLDIVPWSKKFISPGEALKHHDSNGNKRGRR